MTSVLLLLLAGCLCACPDTGVPPPPDVPLGQLLAAPDTVTVEGRDLVLSTYMWRDFMPVTPPDGRPLVAIVTVTATDTAVLHSSIRVDVLWVIHEGQIWKTWLIEEVPPSEPGVLNRIVRVARDGPKWGPHVAVTAVVRIIDSGAQEYLLRASDQWIDRTD